MNNLNAVRNLAKYSSTQKLWGSQACGVPNSSLETKKRGAGKQEIIELSFILKNYRLGIKPSDTQ